MKKFSIFIAAVVCSLMFSMKANAQAPADYFAGKWKTTIFGTPGGDSNMDIILERKDGKLTGGITDAVTKKITMPFTKVEETEKSVTVYFVSQNYNCYLLLEKKDDNNVTGNMLDMFDVTGVRIKPEAETIK